MKTRNIVISFVILTLFIGCSSESDSNNNYSSLQEAAFKTSTNFNSSGIDRGASEFTTVPEIYWAEEIINEHPIRVYSHKNNIALVQKENTNSEEGVYFYVLFSSYLPQNTEDVQYTVIEEDIYKFRKIK